MTRTDIIVLDSGLIGRALWILNNISVIFGLFVVFCMIPGIAFFGSLFFFSDPILAWDQTSPIVLLILITGTGLPLLLALSLVGLFVLPIGNQSVRLHHINKTIRSRLRGSKKWRPVTMATLLAVVLLSSALIGVFIAIVTWNERNQPGITALSGATIGFVLLVIGFWRFSPEVRRWLYFGRLRIETRENDFILLLRSFQGDEHHTKANPLKQVDSIEGMVTDMLERFSSVIAVSDPRNNAQPVGAERLPLDATEWQCRVLELMDRAAGVVVVLDTSPGLSWELDRILEEKHRLSKSVFVVWAEERDWLAGAWTELFERLLRGGTLLLPEQPQGKIALAATCGKNRIRIAAASTRTPLNCGLAVSTLLYLAIFEPEEVDIAAARPPSAPWLRP